MGSILPNKIKGKEDMAKHHILRNGRRTSINIPPLLIELLVFKLHRIPDENDAKGAVKQWLQDTANRNTNTDQRNFSQWMQQEIILYLTSDTEFHRAWQNWRSISNK